MVRSDPSSPVSPPILLPQAAPADMGSGISTKVRPILTCMDTMKLDAREEVQAAIERVAEATAKVRK